MEFLGYVRPHCMTWVLRQASCLSVNRVLPTSISWGMCIRAVMCGRRPAAAHALFLKGQRVIS
jgi:hypothetical protein